jgi:hypothetical protein
MPWALTLLAANLVATTLFLAPRRDEAVRSALMIHLCKKAALDVAPASSSPMNHMRRRVSFFARL